MAITNIKLNGIPSPLGYEPGPLLLSWLVEDSSGSKQVHTKITVYEVAFTGSPIYEIEGLLDWEGTPLKFSPTPRTRYFVEISVTDNLGVTHTGNTWFETGKLNEVWTAKWIGPNTDSDYAPTLSRSFTAEHPPISARLYITGLGLYSASLNGLPITNEVLSPGVWDYETEVQYQTYDVTHLILENNTLDVTLGNGWYAGRFGIENAKPFGNRCALLAELHMTYVDGSQKVIVTDNLWTWRESDIRSTNGIYDGEIIDRLAHSENNNPERTTAYIDIPLRIVDRISQPVIETEILSVVDVLLTPAGETILDFGQNHSGWIRFRSSLPYGTEVHFEFGEVLQHGNFYNDNYRSAIGGFSYRSDGRNETVCPTFTFFGFRFVKVTGWPGDIVAEDFESPVLHSDLERTGWLSTGNQKLNRLYENTLWGQRSNFLFIPTDCPQRDERLGWTGDAQIFAPTACYNMDCRAFYHSYLRFLRSEQQRHAGSVPTYVPSMGNFSACALWSDAAALLPDTLLRFSGSHAEVSEYYPLMRDWVDYVTNLNPGPLYTEGFQLGDWLAQDGISPQSFKGGTDDTFLASVYRMVSTSITAKLAQELGLQEDADKYSVLASSTRSAILETYFTPVGRLSVDTQAAYVTALRFGLWRDKDVLMEQFRRRLKYDNHQIRCGFAGAPLMCSVLAEHGMNDLACDLLLNRNFPGWMYAIELGATTVWERWNSILPDGSISGTGMNSLNHYAYGSVAEYVYAYLAGLRPRENGFRNAIIAPRPDIRLQHLNCSCRTISGQYSCSWRILDDGQLKINIAVPFGCTALVTLPYSTLDPFAVATGTYEYIYTPTKDLRFPYSLDSRLSSLAEDLKAQEILKQELPQLFGILNDNNLEFTTQTFRELSHAFFLGLTPDNISKLVSRLEKLPHQVT